MTPALLLRSYSRPASPIVAALLILCSLAGTTTARAQVRPELVAALEAKAAETGTVRVIVGLDLEVESAGLRFAPEGALSGPEAVQSQRQAIGRAQDRVLAGLAALDAELIVNYGFIPFMAVTVDAAALTALAELPGVASIEEVFSVPLLMASSNPVIGSPSAWAQGFTGAGQVIAVLDSGVDCLHSSFGGGYLFCDSTKIVSEACYSSTIPMEEKESVCLGGISGPGPGTGSPCSAPIVPCSHGTHVAGIVAGDDGVGPNYGVAPDAGLIAIQVTTRKLDCTPDPSPCLKIESNDIISGLQRVAQLAATIPNIASVNMSLGGGQYFDQATCDAVSPATKAAIDSLRALNIATVISAGNSGYRNATGWPGCISTAVSVGATDDADNVASFSNIAPFLDLLAPGVSITSSVPGDPFDPGPHTNLATHEGTSMAAPHVAGAFAVLRQKNPAYSVDDILAALQSTGTLVHDQRSGGLERNIPRINVDLALGAICGADQFEPDNAFWQAGRGIFGGAVSSICPGDDEDWSDFIRSESSAVTLETSIPARISLYDEGLNLLEEGFSSVERTCGVDPLPAGTYFVKVDSQPNGIEIPSYTGSFAAGWCEKTVFSADDTWLRQAIAGPASVPPGGVIKFDPSLNGATIDLTDGQILIDKDLTIDASALPDGIIIDGGGASRVFEIAFGRNVVMKGLTISGGSDVVGGGIRNTVGTLTLIDSTVSDNLASSQGGAIYNYFGDLSLIRVALNGNTSAGDGGAIWAAGATTYVENSTITDNTAQHYAGIVNENGSLTVIHSSVVQNLAVAPSAQGGGLIHLEFGSATTQVENTIVAGNTAVTGADVFKNSGAFSPAGANLIGNNDTASTEFPAGTLVGTPGSPLDPLLGPLGDNGGPTQTMLPLPGSPANDAAIDTPNSPLTDQRGIYRPQAEQSEIGAVEIECLYPGTPIPTAPADGAVLSDSAPTFEWLEPTSGAEVYFVTVQSSSTLIDVIYGAPPGLSFTWPTPLVDDTYTWTVEGSNLCGPYYLPGPPTAPRSFTIATSFDVTVAIAGSGSGAVRDLPGIDCPGDCSETYPGVTNVMLTTHASPDSVFTGWTGSPDCAGTIMADANCTANFDLVSSTIIFQDGFESGDISMWSSP